MAELAAGLGQELFNTRFNATRAIHQLIPNGIASKCKDVFQLCNVVTNASFAINLMQGVQRSDCKELGGGWTCMALQTQLERKQKAALQSIIAQDIAQCKLHWAIQHIATYSYWLQHSLPPSVPTAA
jgi:hypothetical protein